MKANQLLEQLWFNWPVFYLQEMLFLSHSWSSVSYLLQEGGCFVFTLSIISVKMERRKRVEYWIEIKCVEYKVSS
jgi:hypothetical protein